jgi:hypothetical protein
LAYIALKCELLPVVASKDVEEKTLMEIAGEGFFDPLLGECDQCGPV